MGKQLRFIATKKNKQLLSEIINKIVQENDLIIYNIRDKKIINIDTIYEDTYSSIHLFEKKSLKYITGHINDGNIDGLYENGLEIDLGISSKTKLYEYSRLWIDQSQYFEDKSNLYEVYEILIKFIKKYSLGYNKEAMEWMFFEDDFIHTYKKLRKNMYDKSVKKSKLTNENFKIIIETKE